jgi:hypothetical protein
MKVFLWRDRGGGSLQVSKEVARLYWLSSAEVIHLLAMTVKTLAILLPVLLLAACTQETQNRLGRAIQNWTGTNGVLEIYAGDKLVKRFIQIDKLTTATSTEGSATRPYRYGYGVLDENLDGQASTGEKKVYFEFSDYSTSYIFFESPR